MRTTGWVVLFGQQIPGRDLLLVDAEQSVELFFR
jgi:hypothetical protein